MSTGLGVACGEHIRCDLFASAIWVMDLWVGLHVLHGVCLGVVRQLMRQLVAWV